MSLALPARLGVILALLASLLVAAPTASSLARAGAGVFINELHYDNDGTDTGEFVEVAGPAGTDLSTYQLVLYNGSGGAVYDTTSLAGTLPDEAGTGVGAVAFTYPSNGIQNGAPDGIALIHDGAVVEFLSYEGSFTAVGGPADGLVSTDIGVAEGGSTPVGASLQLIGDTAPFTWTGPVAESPGALNDGQLGRDGSGVDDGGDPGDPGDAPAASDVFLNEFHYDNVGGDVGEFVEVAGPAGTDLDGWEVVLYNGANGSAYNTTELTGLLSGPLDSGVGFAIVEYATNGIQNGSPDGLALVDPSGTVVEFFSYEGTFTAVGGPADGIESTDVIVDEDGGTPIGFSLQRTEDCSWTGPLEETRGTANPSQATACDPLDLDDDPVIEPLDVKIHEVQGDGPASPLEDVLVTVEAVVVGDFQNGDAGSQNGDAPPGRALGGFYLQEEDLDADTDPLTSEGVFVFDGTFSGDPAVDVDLGDRVSVTGIVEERFGQTQISVVSGGSVEIVAEDVAMPTPAELTLPFDSLDAPEALEGMLVAATQDLYVAEYFDLDRYGEMVLTHVADGLVTPTQVFAPGSVEQQERADFNLRSQITLDDANGVQNPETVPFVAPPADDGSYVDNRRRGDELTDLVGVLGYGFSEYRVYVDTDVVTTDSFTTTNERPTAVPDVGGDVAVGSFNVLNYFTTIDQGGAGCGPLEIGCRGADNDAELERQTAKTVTAIAELDADVVGLIEIENDGDDSSAATLVEGLNARLGPGTYDYVRTGFIGTDAIKQAFIYQPAAVVPVGEPAVLDTPEFVNGISDEPRSRPALAQTFVDAEGGEVTVVVNHLKSKGSSGTEDACASGALVSDDCDQGDGQGFFNGTRTASAQQLVQWLEDPANGFAEDVLVIGDLNAYAQEDPIQVFLDAGYVNTVLESDEDAYGYVFDAQQGTLDYALASESLATQVTGSAEFGINADEADLIDYDTGFGRDPGYFNPAIPYRASDHDPVITGLELDSVNGPTTADAGGPYEVTVNGGVLLDATGSNDGPGLGLTYAWDLDGDGLFDDVVGATPTWERPGGPPGPKAISVEVTDVLGGMSVADAEVAVLANGRGNDGRPKGRFPANVR